MAHRKVYYYTYDAKALLKQVKQKAKSLGYQTLLDFINTYGKLEKSYHNKKSYSPRMDFSKYWMQDNPPPIDKKTILKQARDIGIKCSYNDPCHMDLRQVGQCATAITPHRKTFGTDAQGRVWMYKGLYDTEQALLSDAHKEIPGFKPKATFSDDDIKQLAQDVRKSVKSSGLVNKFKVSIRKYKTGTDMISIYTHKDNYSMKSLGMTISAKSLEKRLANIPFIRKHNHSWMEMGHNGIPHQGPFASIYCNVSEF